MMPSTEETHVWQAGPADAIIVAALHASSFERAWPAEEIAQFLSAPGCIVLLAARLKEQAAGGMIIMRKAGDEAEILSLAVHPACRRRGLGRALLAKAVKAARDAGVRTLFLEMEEGNEAARGLYKLRGANEVGRRARYYESGADALIFSLAL
jgi:ribosomal-protein-alanine N-acetyltransferase